MNIGIVGAGNVGSCLARYWIRNAHRVMLSYAREEAKLKRTVKDLGTGALVGSPAEAAAFGDVVVLAVPFAAMTDAIQKAGSLAGKILFSTVNALSSDMTGMAVGTTTSAAEEIQKLAAGAQVVESLPSFAELLATGSTSIGGERSTVFCCGDHAGAKGVVAKLLEETGVEVIDVGALSQARFIEPAMMLLVRLAYARGFGGQIAFRFLRNAPGSADVARER